MLYLLFSEHLHANSFSQSAGGIGLAAANALAEAGASAIVFADVDEARVQSAAEQSRKLAIHDNYQARGWHVDVTDQESVEDLVKKTAKEFGRIDYLVNSAGVGCPCVLVLCSDGQLS